MPLLPGEILNKRYRIVCLLGNGAYGAVYRAWDLAEQPGIRAVDDTATGIDAVNVGVAVKEYLDPSPETQKLFRKEARRLGNLRHEQLPAVRDHFCLDDSGQYLISAYVDGVDLANLLDQYGPLPSDLIVGWLQAISVPLDYLHQKKQLHLNVKPANMRLAPSGKLFLVDTGLPGLGVSLGSSGFAAPEAQTQGEVGAASDIYSLGASLYMLLTGKTPPDALHRQSGLEDLIPAREVNPDVEPYLSVVASRAMDLRPDVRFESVTDFSEALARPAGRRPVVTASPRRSGDDRPVAPPPRIPTKRRRQIEQRTIWGLVGAVLLFVGITIGLLLANRTPAAREAQAAATSTIQSQVIAALTAIATVTPTPAPSATPIPTPEPLVSEMTGARMIFVPGGIFRMGNDDAEPDEAPSHIVRLDPYFIDETEVTNGRFALCVEAGECDPPDRPGATFHRAYYGDPAFDEFPVIFVNWFDARTFCNWRGARLPSEAEWERAAGFDPVQGLKFQFPWGDEFDGTLLNFCDNNCARDNKNTAFNDEHGDTAPVATYPGGRSPLGLYDMAGNVMEWVSDWYDPRYYEQSPNTNPLGPLEGEFKALRGGSWLSSAGEVRVTGRSSFDPTVSRANLGFRCAVTAQ